MVRFKLEHDLKWWPQVYSDFQKNCIYLFYAYLYILYRFLKMFVKYNLDIILRAKNWLKKIKQRPPKTFILLNLTNASFCWMSDQLGCACENKESEKSKRQDYRHAWNWSQSQSSLSGETVKTSNYCGKVWIMSDSRWLPMQGKTQECRQEGWRLAWRKRQRRRRDWSSNR